MTNNSKPKANDPNDRLSTLPWRQLAEKCEKSDDGKLDCVVRTYLVPEMNNHARKEVRGFLTRRKLAIGMEFDHRAFRRPVTILNNQLDQRPDPTRLVILALSELPVVPGIPAFAHPRKMTYHFWLQTLLKSLEAQGDHVKVHLLKDLDAAIMNDKLDLEDLPEEAFHAFREYDHLLRTSELRPVHGRKTG